MFELDDLVCAHPWYRVDQGRCLNCGEEGLDANQIYKKAIEAARHEALTIIFNRGAKRRHGRS